MGGCCEADHTQPESQCVPRKIQDLTSAAREIEKNELNPDVELSQPNETPNKEKQIDKRDVLDYGKEDSAKSEYESDEEYQFKNPVKKEVVESESPSNQINQ